jgi:NAD(P)-dependent dehydrogenase (short-subunit alcohol dehydrogenase family)
MDLQGCVALVTGANRGIGAAYIARLQARGAKKIYAATRDADAGGPAGEQVERIRLDVTLQPDIDAVARRCSDVQLLVNNAGVNFNTPLIGHPNVRNAELEMSTNYFGTLNMIRAFAPVLKSNGGGAIINMLSIVGRVNIPLMGSLGASKAAAILMTMGVRAELAAQGTRVVGVMPGAVDTRMTANFPGPKARPADVVDEVLDALVAGTEDVYPGDMAKDIMNAYRTDMKAIEKQFAGYLPRG